MPDGAVTTALILLLSTSGCSVITVEVTLLLLAAEVSAFSVPGASVGRLAAMALTLWMPGGGTLAADGLALPLSMAVGGAILTAPLLRPVADALALPLPLSMAVGGGIWTDPLLLELAALMMLTTPSRDVSGTGGEDASLPPDAVGEGLLALLELLLLVLSSWRLSCI